jgi:NTP pyrophosphatase (non-canonical NTP hydrolase)
MNGEYKHIYEMWEAMAEDNIQQWGIQERETLLLAMQEELGELTQAQLEYEHEHGHPERVREELDDLAALVIQFRRALARDADASPDQDIEP